MAFELVVVVFSFIAGLGAGLLGIGGGVIIIPAFLFIIPLFTTKNFDMAQITGISSAQAFFSSLLAFISHKKYGFVDKEILLKTVLPVVIGSFGGSFLSKAVPQKTLLFIYLAILMISLFFHLKDKQIKATSKHAELRSFIVFFISAFFAGSLGLGGAIFFVPALAYFYLLPIKNSIGNVTFLVLSGSLFSFLGKTISGQVPFELILYIILGAISGAKIGAKLAQKINPVILKRLLLAIMILTALRVAFSLFS
jgi:uncharacterized membrane protein YfcA